MNEINYTPIYWEDSPSTNTPINAFNLNKMDSGINEIATTLNNTDIYEKPSEGIPKTDLSSSVQTSLNKADSAYQKPSDGIPKTDLTSDVQTSLNKADTAYHVPTGGIPVSILSSDVQSSLNRANSAYIKPSSGIPKSDLTSNVKDSLDKADVAYVVPEGGIPYEDLELRVQNILGTCVPHTRIINGHTLTTDINLVASEVGAVPDTRTVNNKSLSSNISLTASDVGALPDDTVIPDLDEFSSLNKDYLLGNLFESNANTWTMYSANNLQTDYIPVIGNRYVYISNSEESITNTFHNMVSVHFYDSNKNVLSSSWVGTTKNVGIEVPADASYLQIFANSTDVIFAGGSMYRKWSVRYDDTEDMTVVPSNVQLYSEINSLKGIVGNANDLLEEV